MNPVSGGLTPRTDIRTPSRLSAGPPYKLHKSAALFLLPSLTTEINSTLLQCTYIYIEKPTNYIHMHLYLYLYICRFGRWVGQSSPLPGLEKLKQKQRAVKAIAFPFFTSKGI